MTFSKDNIVAGCIIVAGALGLWFVMNGHSAQPTVPKPAVETIAPTTAQAPVVTHSTPVVSPSKPKHRAAPVNCKEPVRPLKPLVHHSAPKAPEVPEPAPTPAPAPSWDQQAGGGG